MGNPKLECPTQKPRTGPETKLTGSGREDDWAVTDSSQQSAENDRGEQEEGW